MATNTTSFLKGQKNLQGFTAVLTSAACEWFLIFLLLIDAVLSYLLTKFARYCELQMPCILCSRLDHVLGNEKPGFYWNSLCSTHRSEASSLIFCDSHGKLADGRDMCENCLLSFIRKCKPNSDMHRVFLAKLAFDLGGCGPYAFKSSILNKDIVPASTGTRFCLCCNTFWAPRQINRKSLQLQSSVAKPNIPLPRRLGRRDGSKKIRDKFSGSVTSRRLGKYGSDPLSYVGYTELKITSESESEVFFSDDDNCSSVVHEINEHKEESVVKCTSEVPPKKPSKYSAPMVQPDANETRDVICLVPDVANKNDLSELTWQEADQKTIPSTLPELISLDDIPPPLSDVEVSLGVSPPTQNSNSSAISDFISLVDTLSVDVKDVIIAAPSDNYITDTSEPESVYVNKKEEILKLKNTSTEVGSKADQIPAALNSTSEDASDMHKSAGSAMEREGLEFAAEQYAMMCNNGFNKDLKLLQSGKYPDQGISSSFNNASPRLRGHGAESQIIDECNSDGIQNLQTPVLVDRTESSGFDYLDGSSVSEIEGESIVDKLKRQVEYDRRCINSLHKELEEERNASAIAANQAMAMITRLQEEKAALHMEALQYLRMMEEQAEYDVDALEKANDLLAEKEKEIQDLEAELEFYRLNFPDESMGENVPEESVDLKEEKYSIENTSPSFRRNDSNAPHKSMFPEDSEDNSTSIGISSLSEIEDEKFYISQSLKNLERKLYLLSLHGSSPYVSDCEYSEEAANGGSKQLTCQMGGDCLTIQRDLSASNGRPHEEGSHTSKDTDQVVRKRNGHVVSNVENGSKNCREIDMVTLGNELADLNDRLEALEADCNFLEHSINSIQNGKEGLQFVRDIAYQLRELRKLGIRSRRRNVS